MAFTLCLSKAIGWSKVGDYRVSSGIHTGLPINVYNTAFSGDPADLGTQCGLAGPTTPSRPAAAPTTLVDKVVGTRTCPVVRSTCYTAQTAGFLGNVAAIASPVPGAISADFSITKETKLTEKLNMEFRAEFFNFINHLNLGGSSGGVLATSTHCHWAGLNSPPPATPRQIQFAVKFDF